MISSYLHLKLVQTSRASRATSLDEKREEAQETSLTFPKTSDGFKCRVCLQDGHIPIFGNDDSPDISEPVASFGNIEMSQDDGYPQFICDTCHKLLQSAIMFRKTAQQSDQKLKYIIKFEVQEYDDNLGKDLIKTEIPEDDNVGDSHSPKNDLDLENIEDVKPKTSKKKVILKKETEIPEYDVNFGDSHSPKNDLDLENIEDVKPKTSKKKVILKKETEIPEYDVNFGDSHSPKNDLDLENIEDVKPKTSKKRVILKKKKKSYHCRFCFVDFRFSDEYHDHVNSVEHRKQKVNPYIQCPICNKSLRRNHYFMQHLELHKSDELDKLRCIICKQLYRKGKYKEHLVTHRTTNYNYICEVCGRSFQREHMYKRHFRTHSTDFPYKCESCPYRTNNPDSLNTHMRTHTGDYRYQCSECSARFVNSSNLNRHMITHTGPKHECDTCKQKFSSNHRLQKHIKVDHFGIKEHICNICGKAYGCRRTMLRHTLRVHKREKISDGKGRMPAYLAVQQKKKLETI